MCRYISKLIIYIFILCFLHFAGAEVSGGFKDPAIVIRFEHMASIAQHRRCQAIYNARFDHAHDAVTDFRPVVVTSYRGDATNQDALEKSKVRALDERKENIFAK